MFLNLGIIMYPTPMTIKVRNPSTWKTLWSGKIARANATSAPNRYIIHTEPMVEPMKTKTIEVTTKGLLTGLTLMSPSDNVGSGYSMINMMVATISISLASTMGVALQYWLVPFSRAAFRLGCSASLRWYHLETNGQHTRAIGLTKSVENPIRNQALVIKESRETGQRNSS